LTPENLKNNHHYGDVMTKKPDNTFRLYGINLNSICLDKNGGDLPEVCELMKEVQADIAGFTEPCLDSTKPTLKNYMYKTFKRILQRSKVELSSSECPTEGFYKPGGTMLVSTGNVLARLTASGTDSLGRWSYQTFSGKKGTTVTFVTAYQVCSKSKKGTVTAAAQQESLLRKRGVSNPDPRKHFRQVLLSFLQSLSGEIVLFGDFNEALGSDEKGMIKICQIMHLTDVMASKHDLTEVATYTRGTKRIDYLLATTHAASAVTKCGYEPFQHRYATDHRGFFADFDWA
jgi:hypothetical protein